MRALIRGVGMVCFWGGSLLLFLFWLAAMTHWLGIIVGSILAFILTPGIVIFPLIYWLVEHEVPAVYFEAYGVALAGAVIIGLASWEGSRRERVNAEPAKPSLMRRAGAVASIFAVFVAAQLVLAGGAGIIGSLVFRASTAEWIADSSAAKLITWFIFTGAAATFAVYFVCNRVAAEPKKPAVAFAVISACFYVLLLATALSGITPRNDPDPNLHVYGLLVQALATLGGCPIGYRISKTQRKIRQLSRQQMTSGGTERMLPR